MAPKRSARDRYHQERGTIKAVRLSDGSEFVTPCFVNASGPHLQDVCRQMNIELPVYCELHQKVSFRDTLGVIPRDAPLLIWNDPQVLPWSDEERSFLAGEEELRWLLDRLRLVRPGSGSDSNIALML
jgi:hypothetical protein